MLTDSTGPTGRHVNVPSAKEMGATVQPRPPESESSGQGQLVHRDSSYPGKPQPQPLRWIARFPPSPSQPGELMPFNSHRAATHRDRWAVLGRAALAVLLVPGLPEWLSGKNEAGRRAGKWPAVTQTQGPGSPHRAEPQLRMHRVLPQSRACALQITGSRG